MDDFSSLKEFQILGERCSGTNWLECLVLKNYLSRSSIRFCERGTPKHFFLKTDFAQAREQPPPWCDIVFVAIVRNPFDWLMSLHRTPHHALLNGGMDFGDFIRSQWLSFEGDTTLKEKVVEDFPNVLTMRTAKIRFLMELRNTVNIAFFTHEYLVKDFRRISALERFGFVRKGELENIEKYVHPDNKIGIEPYSPKRYDIPKEDRDFIVSSLDWTLESKMGYREDGTVIPTSLA